MVQNVKKQKECRITTQGNTVSGSLEFMTTSAPLIMNEEHYYIVSLTDTSHEKRRKILERVFFHDVINIAGGLKNIIELMQSPEEPSGNPELLQMADVSATSLLDEIIAQRTLVAAESGDLGINFSESCSGEILLDVQQILAKNDAASNKHIMIATNSQNIHFSTDPVLLRRVLINLAKNALEATKAGGTVIIGAKDLGKSIEFFVNNRGVIPEDVQLQIFQRSFSTKGTNRGIGTYSIKLFTEKYLKGAIRFVSNEELGTTFYVTYQKQAV
jgi:signal transduction histidine kinase